MTANAKVEQRHRDEADAMFYWCLEMDGPEEVRRIAQALANAEQRGREDEREECALEAEAVCVPLKWRHVMPERDVYEEAVQDAVAAIRARGQRKESE